MSLTGPSTSWTVLLPGFVLAGIGWGLANPAMVEGALAAVSPGEAGMASGMLNFARQTGLAAGVAALGGAFHHAVAQRMAAGSATVDAVASGATTAHLKAGLSPADAALFQDAARAALAHGIDVVSLAGAVIIVAGSAGSLVLARGRRTERVAVVVPQPAGAS
jgi:hypothetical protein